jgi:hypothetical protein
MMRASAYFVDQTYWRMRKITELEAQPVYQAAICPAAVSQLV